MVAFLLAARGAPAVLGLVLAGLVHATALAGVALAETVELAIFEDATAVDDPTDGVFDFFASAGTVTAHSQVTNFLNIFITERALFEFDLSAVPAGAIIESATLTMYATKTSHGGSGADFDVHGYTGDGVVEISDADSSEGVVLSFHVDSTGFYGLDLAAAVQGYLDASASVLGLNIRAQSEGPDPFGHDDEVGFSPSESTSVVFPPPVFLVEYTIPSVPGVPVWSRLVLAAALPCAGALRLLTCARLRRSRG